jgi:carbonic anhydrase
MHTQTKKIRDLLTPELALNTLKNGNQRFIRNLSLQKDLLRQVNETSSGQYPIAAILSCIDSRTSAELIFDQGLGDIFSIRIAGNIINEDILGSMEFACKVAGSKLIVVLGHTKCSAIESACNRLVLGHMTQLLQKITVAPDSTPYDVTKANVFLTIQKIRDQSSILREMEQKKQIKIIGGLYDLDTGLVEFYE